MKILAFTDMHGSKEALKKLAEKAKKADIILCCGDFTVFGKRQKYFLSEFNKLKKTMLIIPGNHETDEELKKDIKGYSYLRYMQNSMYKDDKIIVLGAEGNGFSTTDRVFSKVSKAFEAMLKKENKEGSRQRCYILMTHAPPYGTELDKITGEHCGNKAIRSFIIKTQPKYVFSGHIHENKGKIGYIRKTKIINPGPEGRIITIKAENKSRN